jgi:Domain of unknown function (DUF4333)
MSWLGRSGAIAALLAAALLAIGCGTAIDSSKEEALIEENLHSTQGQKVASVECPSGVEVEAHKTFKCEVKLADGTRETVTMRIVNSDADTEIANLHVDK